MTTYTVDAPPPGTWLRFADHFPHALTPEYTRLYRATFEPAQAAWRRRSSTATSTSAPSR